MAIQVTVVDDLTGSEPATRTTRVSFDGQYVDFHLSEASYQRLLAEFTKLAAKGSSTTASAKLRQPDEWLQMTVSHPVQPKGDAAPEKQAPVEEPRGLTQTSLDIEGTDKEPPQAQAKSKAKSPVRSQVKSSELDPEARRAIREWAAKHPWAKQHGVTAPGMGRLPQHTIDQYFDFLNSTAKQ